MRSRIGILFVAVAAFVLASCQDKGESADKISVLKVDKSLVQVDAAGGDYTVSYTSVGEAYGKVALADIDADWVKITDVTAIGVGIKVEPNETASDRSSKLVISGNGAKPVTVHILQSKVSDAKPAYRNFTVNISNVSSFSATVEVDPLNPSAYYYTDLFTAAQYEQYGEDYLVKSMFDYVVSMVAMSGVSDPRLLLYQGYYNTSYDENVSLDLRDDTDYYVLVLDMDVNESGNLISSGKGEFHKFRTLKASQVDMDFSFDIKGTQVEVTPSADFTYVCGVVSKAQWKEYADPRDAARDYIAIAKQYNMLETIVYSGKRLVDFTYLLESTGDYVVYAVGYRNSATDKGLTTEIVSQEFHYVAR